MANDVVDEKRVLARWSLIRQSPGQLHVLVADVLDQVGIDERSLDAHPAMPQTPASSMWLRRTMA